MNNRRESKFYIIIRPIIAFLFKIFYRPTIKGINNIPKEGKIIIAGTHTSKKDPLLLMAAVKRPIHFFTKIELFKFPKGIIFKHLGLIPVDRSIKSSEPLKIGEEYLNKDMLVCIFPEGTTEKEKVLLPFKVGTVKLAKDTKTKVVPFVIKNEYKLFRKSVIIEFLNPFEVKGDIEKENEKFRNLIKKELED